MKATLTFTLPEEKDDFEAATKALDYKLALWEVAQEIFRPARKHGYSGPVQKLLDKANEVTIVLGGEFKCEVGVGDELIGELEKMFYEILRERGIEL